MLTVTASAAEAINHLLADRGVRKGGGVRMVLNETGAILSVEAAAHPAPGDDIIDTAGTQMFLARETRIRLADRVVDVHEDVDGQFTFLVAS